jgi:hypothetical protein
MADTRIDTQAERPAALKRARAEIEAGKQARLRARILALRASYPRMGAGEMAYRTGIPPHLVRRAARESADRKKIKNATNESPAGPAFPSLRRGGARGGV